MRAFAGESQARNRYTFAAEIAKKQGLYVIEAVFKYTADQELAHANVFMKHLSELNGETVEIDGGYPVEVTNSVIELLENAVHNETEEYEDVYKSFGETVSETLLGTRKAAIRTYRITALHNLYIFSKSFYLLPVTNCQWPNKLSFNMFF